MRHFYWSVTSTKEKLGELKLAKFQSFLSHVTNKHTEVPHKLYNACKHGVITKPKVWMTQGSNLSPIITLIPGFQEGLLDKQNCLELVGVNLLSC